MHSIECKEIQRNNNQLRIWEILPDMLLPRASHGCGRTTMKDSDYLMVLGGLNGDSPTDIIHFFNLEKRVWESFPSQFALPWMMDVIIGVLNLRLDENGCEMMIASSDPTPMLFVCTGNFQWKTFDLTGTLEAGLQMVVVGANELLPCGIY